MQQIQEQDLFAGDFERGLFIIRGSDGWYIVIRDDGTGPRFEKRFRQYNDAENFQRAFFAPMKRERRAA